MAEKVMTEITIYDVDALALTLLVDFAYIGELVICEDNVQVWRNNLILSIFDINNKPDRIFSSDIFSTSLS